MFRAALLALALLGASSAQARPTARPAEVIVVATIHGLHAKNPNYPYEAVYGLVRRLHPDYVGVEIRPEDMPRGDAYLRKLYPLEMIEAAKAWGVRCFGFDWLGDDIAGRPVPDDWWSKRSPLKKLERELDQDARFKDAELDRLGADEAAIARTASAAELNDGRYDRLSARYYARLRQRLTGSRYASLSRFYAERDRRLAENIAAQVRKHPGDRFVILTGADHRGALMRRLPKLLGSAVRLESVTDQDVA